ncbi:Ig-like domain-containing protein, partial [Flavihumibacter solisilvae]
TIAGLVATGTDLQWYSVSSGGSVLAPQTALATGTYHVSQRINGCESSRRPVTVTVNTTPTISVSAASPTICSGTSTTLTASGGATYSWSPATGLSSTTGTSVSANPTVTTTYTITGTAANGCTNTATITVTVNAPATVTAGAPFTVCQSATPTPITLSGAGIGGGATTGAWSIVSGGGALSSTLQTANPAIVTYTPVANATLPVTLRLTTNDPAGPCASTNNTVVISFNPMPTVAAITSPATVCAGSSINATNTTPGGTWSTSNPAIATVNGTGVVTGVASGNVDILYTVTGANGCTRQVVRAIIVNPRPVLTVPIPAAFCSGNSVTLTASGASTYAWSPAEGLSIASGATVIATPNVTTTYTVTGTNNGCTGSTTVTTTVIQGPEGSLSSTPPVCYGNNGGTLTLSNNTGSILRWESSNNGGASWTNISNTSTTFTYSNLTQTTIYRAVLSLNGCTDYSSTGIVPVNPLFVPTVTTTPSVICIGESAVLAASGYGQPPFPIEDFSNANPAGWSGNEANNNNEDPDSDWGESGSGKIFNGVTYRSNAPPTNTKFMIITGTTDGPGNTGSLVTAPFSLVGTVNPIFNYHTALNFNAGTSGAVEVSVDGGATYITLKTYTGPVNVGNPNNGWIQESINLSAYIGQSNVRVRFRYTGTAGSNWAVDNVGVASTFQPVTYQWSPLNDMNPSPGNTQSVTITPTTSGTFPYCVVATSAVGCASPSVCTNVLVNPLATVNAGAPVVVCQSTTPAAITLSGASIGGSATTGAWTITSGGGTLSSGSQTANPDIVTYTPPANFSGTVTLTLTTNDPAGPCAAVTATRVITINQAATVAVGGPYLICQSSNPSPITLAGSGIGGGATTGAWSIVSGGGTLSNLAQTATPGAITYTPAAGFSGTVVLSLITNDPDGAGPCEPVSATVTVVVNPLLVATSAGSNALCFGTATGSATVNVSGGTAPFTYSWNTSPVQTTATASNLIAGT